MYIAKIIARIVPPVKNLREVFVKETKKSEKKWNFIAFFIPDVI